LTTPTPGETFLVAPASAGDSEIQVASTEGLAEGDDILINPGGGNEEGNTIAGFGSILLTSPLQFDHQAGETVARVEATPTATPTPTPTPTPEGCVDLDDDGRVSGRDISIVARALFSQPGDKRWNPVADLNDDARVNLSDLFVVLSSLHDRDCR